MKNVYTIMVFVIPSLCLLVSIEMSIMSKLPTRICLVGGAGQDASTVQAAESFGLPIIQSQTGLDILNDMEWRTYYVLQDFEDEIFDAIHKQKEW